MKSVAYFDGFLADVVNLNDTRIDLLDGSFEAIKRFLRSTDYGAKIASFYRHGSWAHRTIIRPVEGSAFDADVIMFVRPVDGWTAADYLNDLARVFRESSIYEGKYRRFSHCVTIEYAGERKMDIAPCVVDRAEEGAFEVCNRVTNQFQRTEPERYTTWLSDKNSQSGRNSLRKVTRLLKYLRDIKATFTCPSFLLTTLLGMQVRDGDKDGIDFADLPTALRTMTGRLDDWLQARAVVPNVFNPVLPAEDQAVGWTDIQYANFRAQVNRYRAWIDDAYAEVDSSKSLAKWRKVFGDEFGYVRRSAGAVVAVHPAGDDVDILRKRGLSAVSPMVLAPTWRNAPLWRASVVPQIVATRARLVSFSHGRTMPIRSGMPVEAGQWIEFWSLVGGHLPSLDYETHWRITNTGSVAAEKKQLRGEFNASDIGAPHHRREHLEYRGIHMAEAFVVRRSDQLLIGHSKPFYVVIE